ncbi:MAG: hypothetical protein GY795_42340 [Desulfobacterales bacterium]|nr:hypothetical protein [Desulfobacterales bacterium]
MNKFTTFFKADWKWALGTFISFLGIVVATGLFIISEKEKVLSCEVVSKTPIGKFDKESFPNIEVTYKDKKISNGGFFTIRIKNSGDIPINHTDFESPIIIHFDTNSKILKAFIKEKNPKNINSTMSYKKNIISITGSLLNPNDNFTIQGLIEGSMESISATARISGINEINLKTDTFKEIKIIIAIVLLVHSMLALITTSILSSSFTAEGISVISVRLPGLWLIMLVAICSVVISLYISAILIGYNFGWKTGIPIIIGVFILSEVLSFPFKTKIIPTITVREKLFTLIKNSKEKNEKDIGVEVIKISKKDN